MMESWELPLESIYIAKGMEFKDQSIEQCRKVKGKGVNLGHMKNDVFLGLFMAAKAEGLTPEETKNYGKHMRINLYCVSSNVCKVSADSLKPRASKRRYGTIWRRWAKVARLSRKH